MHLLGYASGLAGVDKNVKDAPRVLQTSILGHYLWDAIIEPAVKCDQLRQDEMIRNVCLDLAQKTAKLVRAKQRFCVIGGDHTAAIGTWSGAHDALLANGDLGLIWFDAHMDSHTPETTESGRVHGMPLACLLGYGYPTLTGILSDHPKLKPANVCLIGVRSFERGEAALLQRLNVRIYMMEEVTTRGLTTVMQEAVAMMHANTRAYGISIDLDCLDPQDAPGVDVPEPNGIKPNDLLAALDCIITDPQFLGAEIVEFNPHRDREQKTANIIVALLKVLDNVKS